MARTPSTLQLASTVPWKMQIGKSRVDANCNVEGVRAIQQSFAEQGKDNLTVRIYEGYDHDLLYSMYLVYGTLPQAFEDLFQSIV